MIDGILILIAILIAIPITSLIFAFVFNLEIPFYKIITKKEEKSIVDLLTGYGYRYYQSHHYIYFLFRKVYTMNMIFQNESDNIEITVKKKYILEFRIEKIYNPPKNHVRARAETIKTLQKMKKFCESGIEGYFDLLDKNEELQQKLKKIDNDF